MATIHEIAPDVFRLSVYVSQFDMQFNHFLVKDAEPLLFHTAYKQFFPELREAVSSLVDPAKLRWVAWSHFESDECGALNHWLEVAPQAQPVCTLVGKLVPYTIKTEGVLRGLAELKPEALAVMHGSSFVGPCDRLLNGLAGVIKEAFENG